jgi:broad specificity phosphatase PhoE
MKTTAHYIRHGTYENPEGIVPGRMPGFHLSDPGIQKVHKAGKFLKDHKIAHIYTSPLERTFETANILTEFFPGVKVSHSYDLIEIDARYWQAYKYEELFTNDYYEAFINDPATDKVPENVSQLAHRMKQFAFKVIEKHAGKELICVSHAFPIIALRLALENKPLTLFKNYSVSTASITTFVFDEDSKLLESHYTEFQAVPHDSPSLVDHHPH